MLEVPVYCIIVSMVRSCRRTSTYGSCVEEPRCELSLEIYSVFRSQGTCTGNGVVERPPSAYAPPDEAGSPRRNLSFVSKTGRLCGSGFRAANKTFSIPQ